jgi:hypothetical protein
MFWIDTGDRPAIMSASMNGENPKVLVDTQLDSPSGLTIDYYMNRIFWCDSKTGVVESIKQDGSDRVKISHRGLRNPFKIDSFENHIYWMSKDLGSINKVDKFGRGAIIELVNGLDLIEDIKVFHSFKVPTNIENECSIGNCSHLCLLMPDKRAECHCPDSTNLLESDLFTCDAPLESELQLPMECRCFNCWCWYNDFGVHSKCHPGKKRFEINEILLIDFSK